MIRVSYLGITATDGLAGLSAGLLTPPGFLPTDLSAMAECVNCPEDVNGDQTVDVQDLLMVLAAWGATTGPEDINGDGVVDVADLLLLLAAWGPCP